MERVQTLINKLQEQIQNNTNKEQMLYMAQLLVAELNNITEEKIEKVSVLMPTAFTNSPNGNIVRIELENNESSSFETISKNDFVNEAAQNSFEKAESEKQETLEIVINLDKNYKAEEVINPVTTINQVETLEVEEKNLINEDLFEGSKLDTKPFLSKPTIIERKELLNNVFNQQNKIVYELNDTILDEEISINDKLKVKSNEVGTTILQSPVKDLRKAIGINDKYLFINELFSKDEAMYERSIKTINNFGTYKEAEQWMNRELYTKLCWLKDSTIVESFYSLVKRRFSEM